MCSVLSRVSMFCSVPTNYNSFCYKTHHTFAPVLHCSLKKLCHFKYLPWKKEYHNSYVFVHAQHPLILSLSLHFSSSIMMRGVGLIWILSIHFPSSSPSTSATRKVNKILQCDYLLHRHQKLVPFIKTMYFLKYIYTFHYFFSKHSTSGFFYLVSVNVHWPPPFIGTWKSPNHHTSLCHVHHRLYFSVYLFMPTCMHSFPMQNLRDFVFKYEMKCWSPFSLLSNYKLLN